MNTAMRTLEGIGIISLFILFELLALFAIGTFINNRYYSGASPLEPDADMLIAMRNNWKDSEVNSR